MPEKSVPIKWRSQKQRYMLTGSKCDCGKIYYPPRGVCDCGKTTKEYGLGGTGVVVSYTEIHSAPIGFEGTTPYTVALIKLDEGPVIPGHIVGGKAAIGEKVKPVFRKITEGDENTAISYIIKFTAV